METKPPKFKAGDLVEVEWHGEKKRAEIVEYIGYADTVERVYQVAVQLPNFESLTNFHVQESRITAFYPPEAPEVTPENAVRYATQRLVTVVIDRAGAFGMVFGEISWDAGDSAGDRAYPKRRSLYDLSLAECAQVLEHVAEHLTDTPQD